ncbi:MAG TPA: cytochrome c biogenesis protein CcsA [Chthonomonadaceae bacterium]|nr:cytochrome c biogenesis protein CcsA [Chthonomonadaceae bacterium]
MTSAILTSLAFALYLATAVCYGAILFLHAPSAPTLRANGADSNRTARLGRPLLLAGILVQFAAIGFWCAFTHRSPFASEYGTLMVAAWAIALAFAILDFRTKLPLVGAIALLVACVLLGWGVAHAGGPVAENPLLNQQIVSVHVLAIVTSFGLFAVAFGCAALYLLQNRLLKEHSVSGLFRRIPPLATLDSVAYHAVAYALPLLTLGLAVGFAQAFGGAGHHSPREWLLDAKTLVSIATWFLYVFYLGARLVVGWRGVRLQYILLAGLFVTLALYIVPTTAHRFN